MVKLVMTDLDDTLIPFGFDHASLKAISAIHALVNAGIHFGPVTGRMPASMKWMFQGDEVCYRTGAFANGQIVTVDGIAIQRVMISGEDLRKVAVYLDRMDADAWLAIYNPDDLNDTNLVTRFPERVASNPPDTWGKSVFGVVPDVQDRDYLKANIQCSCSRDQMTQLRDNLRELVPSLSFVMPSMTAKVIDVNAGEWDKGDSVRLIADYLDVSLDEVVVFGDSENDLPMIEAVPDSVAVANSDKNVMRAARWKIPDSKSDSVAKAIESIAMYPEKPLEELLKAI
ncbi:HAD family phosphatase [Olsenella umbonata]|uniref:HAD family phosphatase n=1 Tax=Parafannyhessea umbonata TaxID=604330 RepID=A0A7X9TB62_9ACTN|nr:HAD family hydrolase [Parafannyhessea umbonata]NMF26164.1 HAD family phosphatase [Parafannyhessea umbonata]